MRSACRTSSRPAPQSRFGAPRRERRCAAHDRTRHLGRGPVAVGRPHHRGGAGHEWRGERGARRSDRGLGARRDARGARGDHLDALRRRHEIHLRAAGRFATRPGSRSAARVLPRRARRAPRGEEVAWRHAAGVADGGHDQRARELQRAQRVDERARGHGRRRDVDDLCALPAQPSEGRDESLREHGFAHEVGRRMRADSSVASGTMPTTPTSGRLATSRLATAVPCPVGSWGRSAPPAELFSSGACSGARRSSSTPESAMPTIIPAADRARQVDRAAPAGKRLLGVRADAAARPRARPRA